MNGPNVVNDHTIVNLNCPNVVHDRIVVNCPNVVNNPTVVHCPYTFVNEQNVLNCPTVVNDPNVVIKCKKTTTPHFRNNSQINY